MQDEGDRQDRRSSAGEMCAVCGELVGEPSGAYHLRGRGLICYECATRHGGIYDPENEDWRVSPDLPPGVRREHV